MITIKDLFIYSDSWISYYLGTVGGTFEELISNAIIEEVGKNGEEITTYPIEAASIKVYEAVELAVSSAYRRAKG